MIDLHCHVLPGIDDGPASTDDAVALVHDARAAGADTLVATPHVNWRYPNAAATIRQLVGELAAALAGSDSEARTASLAGIERDGEAGPDRATGAEGKRPPGPHGALAILPGAEVAAAIVLDIEPDELARLTLGHSGCLLLEPPMTRAGPALELVVAHLHRRGHRVLLAHPERCPLFQRHPTRLRSLVDSGALTSITAGALAGRFGGPVRRFAIELVAQGLVHNVASDFHDRGARRPGALAELAQAGLQQLAPWLTQEVPAAILADRELPPRPAFAMPAAAGRRGWWRRVRSDPEPARALPDDRLR